jgi:spore germination protein
MYLLLRLILIFCCFFYLTGCWDSRDIEQLYMEIGAALDKPNVPSSPSEQGDHKQNSIKLTLQNISPSFTPSDQGRKQKYQNLTGVGDSILEIFREFSLKNDSPPYGQHLKVLVIGEKLVKEKNLRILLSLFDRSIEVRDSCILLIAKGEAANTLKISTDIPAFTLIGIGENQYNSANLLPITTLGKASRFMANQDNFIIQSVGTKKGKIRFNSGAIIKGGVNRLVGFLDEDEVKGLNILTGKIKGGIIKGKDSKTNGLILYNISSVKSKITPHLNENKISFDVNIESVGQLNEDWVHTGNAFSNKFIHRAEKAIKEETEQLIRQTLMKLQKKEQIDVAGFGEQIRINYPKQWSQMKKNWDKRFCEVPIKLTVSITIKDYMVKGKKEGSK